MRTLIDGDGDVWTEVRPDEWESPSISPDFTRSLDYIREEYGPVEIEGESASDSDVFLLTSTDSGDVTTTLLVTSRESLARDLAEALKSADSRNYYSYRVERKPVVN